MLAFLSIAINLILSSAAISNIYNGYNVGWMVLLLVVNIIMAVFTLICFIVAGMPDE